MFGVDFRIVDIKQIKGISNCHIIFDFGHFERCTFVNNAESCGGVFGIIKPPLDFDTKRLLTGEFKIVVLSPKKQFEVLCDGSHDVVLTSMQSDCPLFIEASLKHTFNVVGQQTVSMELFYRNKGPIRIKAGIVQIMISIVDLSSTSGAPLTAEHVPCNRKTCQVHASCDIAVQTVSQSAEPAVATTDSNTSRDCSGFSSYSSFSTEDSISESDGEDSIDEFIQRFTRTTSVSIAAPAVPVVASVPHAPTPASQLAPTSSDSQVKKPQPPKKKQPKYWYTSQQILAVPAPTNMQRLKQRQQRQQQQDQQKSVRSKSAAGVARAPFDSSSTGNASAQPVHKSSDPVDHVTTQLAHVPVRQQVVSGTVGR